jgi:hypothetical protein
MIDVYRWTNQAMWNSYGIVALEFVRRLDTENFWNVPPSGYIYNRWVQLVELSNTNPWDKWGRVGLLDMNKLAYPARPNPTGPSLYTDPTKAVFALFVLFLTRSVSYIIEHMQTELGRDHASHMIQSMEGMWERVHGMLADDDPIKVVVQDYLNGIKAEILRRGAMRPAVDEGSSSSRSQTQGD